MEKPKSLFYVIENFDKGNIFHSVYETEDTAKEICEDELPIGKNRCLRIWEVSAKSSSDAINKTVEGPETNYKNLRLCVEYNQDIGFVVMDNNGSFIFCNSKSEARDFCDSRFLTDEEKDLEREWYVGDKYDYQDIYEKYEMLNQEKQKYFARKQKNVVAELE